METLEKILLPQIKEEIFTLCHNINPHHTQYEENGDKVQIYHAIKLIDSKGTFHVRDVSRTTPAEITNKFLLYKIREQLLADYQLIVNSKEEEEAVEALALMVGNDGEPVHSEIEEAERILSESKQLESEIQE